MSATLTPPGSADPAGTSRLAVMQPYLFPGIAYFHLVDAADRFVFLDDVQFVARRWTHRNQIEVNGAPHLFTIPLAARSRNRMLDEIALGSDYPRWHQRFIQTLRHAYGPRVADRIAEVDALLAARDDDTVASVAERTVRWAAELLGLGADWHRASAIGVGDGLVGADRIGALCRHFDATTYVNMPGGRALYEPGMFRAENVALRFIEPGQCDAGLSILHELLRHGVEETRARAMRYTLVDGEPA